MKKKSCLFCDDVCRYCHPMKDSKFNTRNAWQRNNVLIGLHPLGAGLCKGESTCGECRHRFGYIHKERFVYKCALFYPDVISGFTRIRLKWGACELFDNGTIDKRDRRNLLHKLRKNTRY